MRVSLGHLLPALLLCAPQIAHAAADQPGDYWMVHHQGGANTHEIIVVDGDPAHMPARANGAVSLTVHRLYEGVDKPVMTTYETDVDCAGKRIRLQKASDLEWDMKTSKPVSVSSSWQTAPEAWLAKARDFACQPATRSGMGMTPLGRMHVFGMIDNVNGRFRVLQREQSWAPVLKMIDDAFDRMPQN
ncbi:hypothetical protein [Stenotrophomonas sp. AB1(2024)]|uniref:hypothetical protein n=1 Tax=Stenotrophomonas sp. AB1(2024) TaxID=3132215 RepID=UPI0030AB07FF